MTYRKLGKPGCGNVSLRIPTYYCASGPGESGRAGETARCFRFPCPAPGQSRGASHRAPELQIAKVSPISMMARGSSAHAPGRHAPAPRSKARQCGHWPRLSRRGRESCGYHDRRTPRASEAQPPRWLLVPPPRTPRARAAPCDRSSSRVRRPLWRVWRGARAYIISDVAFFFLSAETASISASGSSHVRILTAGEARMRVRMMKRESGTMPSHHFWKSSS